MEFDFAPPKNPKFPLARSGDLSQVSLTSPAWHKGAKANKFAQPDAWAFSMADASSSEEGGSIKAVR